MAGRYRPACLPAGFLRLFKIREPAGFFIIRNFSAYQEPKGDQIPGGMFYIRLNYFPASLRKSSVNLRTASSLVAQEVTKRTAVWESSIFC